MFVRWVIVACSVVVLLFCVAGPVFAAFGIFQINGPAAGVWILATGLWNDSGVWVDSAVWID